MRGLSPDVSALDWDQGKLSPDVPSLTFETLLKLSFSPMLCEKDIGLCLTCLSMGVRAGVTQEWTTPASGCDNREELDKTCQVSEATLWLPLAKQLCSQCRMILTSLGAPCSWISTWCSKGTQFQTQVLDCMRQKQSFIRDNFHQQVHK